MTFQTPEQLLDCTSSRSNNSYTSKIYIPSFGFLNQRRKLGCKKLGSHDESSM